MVKRVSLGRWGDGSYRLRVSRPGFDVDNTALTPSQLAFDSTLDGYGQLLYTGMASMPDGMSNYPLVTWPDLGYVPTVFMYRYCGAAPRDPTICMGLVGLNNVGNGGLIIRSNGIFGYGSIYMYGSYSFRIFTYYVLSNRAV